MATITTRELADIRYGTEPTSPRVRAARHAAIVRILHSAGLRRNETGTWNRVDDVIQALLAANPAKRGRDTSPAALAAMETATHDAYQTLLHSAEKVAQTDPRSITDKELRSAFQPHGTAKTAVSSAVTTGDTGAYANICRGYAEANASLVVACVRANATTTTPTTTTPATAEIRKAKRAFTQARRDYCDAVTRLAEFRAMTRKLVDITC